ncbi:MAG: hypothetical protein JWM04_47 [Verrucomicrobiales bacterium]|jgi:hypothetical protein|nr:hypothetical protein [Verrucomicrobiales bacterium]
MKLNWTSCHFFPLMVGLFLLTVGASKGAVIDADGRGSFWLETSLHRVFPTSAPTPGSTNLQLLAARQSKMAFQVCLQNRRAEPLVVDCKVLGIDDMKPQVRLVGFAPVWHHTPNTPDSELDGVGKIPGLVLQKWLILPFLAVQRQARGHLIYDSCFRV